MENLFYILFLIAGVAFPGLSLLLFFSRKKIKKLEENLAKYEEIIGHLKKKYELNPGYECQMMMAELLSGNGLFKIERIETENLFYRRG